MSFQCSDVAESTFFTTSIRFLHVQCTSIDVFVLFLVLAFVLTGVRIYLGNELGQEKRNMQLNIRKYDINGNTRPEWSQSFTRFMALEFIANIAWMIYVLLIVTVNFYTLLTLLASYMFFNYIYFKYDLLGFDTRENISTITTQDREESTTVANRYSRVYDLDSE